MQALKWIFIVIIIFIVLGFALQNQNQPVSIKVIQWQSPILPVYWFLYASFILGLLFWFVISTINIIRIKTDNRKLKKDIQKLRKELDRLRNVNIDESPALPEANDNKAEDQKEDQKKP